jgi:hypothetical protein
MNSFPGGELLIWASASRARFERKCRGSQAVFANATAGVTGPIRVQVIGMDACSGSHFLGRGQQTEVARISKRGNSYLRRLFVQGARVRCRIAANRLLD